MVHIPDVQTHIVPDLVQPTGQQAMGAERDRITVSLISNRKGPRLARRVLIHAQQRDFAGGLADRDERLVGRGPIERTEARYLQMGRQHFIVQVLRAIERVDAAQPE